MPSTPLSLASRLLLACLLACLWVLPAGPAAAASLSSPPQTPGGEAPRLAQSTPKKRSTRRKRSRKKKAEEAAPTEEAAPDASKASGGVGGLRRSNRMEFDARLIQGSTPEAGAVYLFERAPRQLPALVRLRQSWLQQIVDPVLGPGRLLPAPDPAAEAVKADK